MGNGRGVLAGLLASALVLPATAGIAVAEEPDAAPTAADEAIEEIHEAAREEGLPNGDLLLQQEVTIELPDEDGDDTEPVTITVEDAIVRVLGRTIVDTEEHSGVAGLPWGSAGNMLHLYADIDTLFYSGAWLPEDQRPALDPEDYLHYDIVESDWVPSTPIVPVINPLLLAPSEVPQPDEPSLPPLLFTHFGGPLTSVQADGGWDLGVHSAGTTPLGSSVDTQDRTEDEDAALPFWVPLVEDGDLAVPDQGIDFAGFAIVTQDAECPRVVVTERQPSTFLPNGLLIYADVCVGFGLLLGDGVAFFDGEGPFDLRQDGALLWEPAPEPIKQVVDAVGDGLDQVPTEDVLEAVTDLLGGDLPGLPGDEDPDGEAPGDDDADDAEAAPSQGNVIGDLLGSFGR